MGHSSPEPEDCAPVSPTPHSSMRRSPRSWRDIAPPKSVLLTSPRTTPIRWTSPTNGVISRRSASRPAQHDLHADARRTSGGANHPRSNDAQSSSSRATSRYPGFGERSLRHARPRFAACAAKWSSSRARTRSVVGAPSTSTRSRACRSVCSVADPAHPPRSDRRIPCEVPPRSCCVGDTGCQAVVRIVIPGSDVGDEVVEVAGVAGDHDRTGQRCPDPLCRCAQWEGLAAGRGQLSRYTRYSTPKPG